MDTHPEATVSGPDLQELRETLLRLRQENEHDLAEARATLEAMSADHSLIDASMREVAANAEYMVDDASSIIAKIDAALARMDAGTYGMCTKCGQAIVLERLQLRPYGATCVPCSG